MAGARMIGKGLGLGRTVQADKRGHGRVHANMCDDSKVQRNSHHKIAILIAWPKLRAPSKLAC